TTAPAASTEPAESESPEASEPPESPEASKSPAAATAEDADDNDGPPSAEQIADVVGRLKAAGIPATAIEVQVLSGKVGLGGAVRVLAFSQASGKTPGQILAMFTSGMGWGQIRHELNLSIGPGIGWIIGPGHGNGKGPKP